MGLSKSDFDKLDARIKSITEQNVEQIGINSDLPPTVEQLEDNNKTYAIMAAILFIDIRKSTYLTENSQAKSMVKIYRSFMRMAVDCVRKNGGVTRQFLGDRIMGVFIDSVDKEGNVSEKAVDKAVNAARSLQTVIDYSLNKHLKLNINGKMIECGIGIDYGKVLVTWVGMHGVESDENKEDEKNCVWVGNTTNHASKYSDIAVGGEVFISESVYKNLSEKYKEVWSKSAKYKGTKLFQGYVTKDYYLDFSEELGNAFKIEQDSTVEADTYNQLVSGIKEIERQQNKLIQREKELAVLEENLKKENEGYKAKYNNANAEKVSACNKRDEIEGELDELRNEFYELIEKILSKVHCKEYQYINRIGKEDLYSLIKREYELGEQIGKSERNVSKDLDCMLIQIYSFFNDFAKAYEMTLIMAEEEDYWMYLDESTLKWAKENNVLYKLYNAIERALVNYKVKFERRKNFEGYLQTIKKIRGY